mmetsp:Transcript_4925/g.7501  ORF Transcript_4925/g.7501 Transcript_4925/m.7501 type:complete len:225 (+) Transcript_4925:2303-2977(+)
MCNLVSIAFAAARRSLFLSLIEVDACSYCASQSAHSFSVKKRTPKTNVLRPSDANMPSWDCMLSKVKTSHSSPAEVSSLLSEELKLCPNCPFADIKCIPPSHISGSSIEESAPLHMSIGIEPIFAGDLTKTDIRFLSESNLLTARTFHVSCADPGSSPLNFFSDAEISFCSWLVLFPMVGEAVSAAICFALSLPFLKPFEIAATDSKDGEEHDTFTPSESRPMS